MKTWPIIWMALACLLVGCRTDPAITMLERENRMLEDEIYRLRGVVEDYQQGLTPNCGQPVEGAVPYTAPAPSVPPPGESRSSVPRTMSRAEAERDLSAPRIIVPSESEPPGTLPRTLESPAGLPAGERDQPESRPPASGSPGDTAPSFTPSSGASRSNAFPAAERDGPLIGFHDGARNWGPSRGASPAPGDSPGVENVSLTGVEEPVPFEDSREASEIKLNRTMTGGYDFDAQSGDEGIQAVFEVCDRRGRSLLAPADVSLVLYDPELDGPREGEAARIGRWDFSAETVAELFRTDGARKALFLEAPWPDGTHPRHKKLHLFVRYTTRDGRNLQADQPVEIALRGERIDRRSSPKSAEREPKPLPAEEFSAGVSGRRAAEEEPLDSSSLPAPPRIASRENALTVTRPVWNPERR